MGAVVNEEAFCLKWNDFHTSLTSTFTELRAESDLLDATIFCEGKEIRGAIFCHLAVLIYLCGEVSKKGCQGSCPVERKGNCISILVHFFISTQRYVRGYPKSCP